MNKVQRKLLKPFDVLFNGKIKNYCLGPNAVEIIGQRGVGKSTIYALVAEMAKKDGKKVYCQYPYEGCYNRYPSREDSFPLLTRITEQTFVNSDKEPSSSCNTQHE